MKFYQNLDKKTLKLFETIKSTLPPPPIQQPIRSPDTTLVPLDTSYKPISPFTSPPGDTSRPPVPSRRLKPANEIEESKSIVPIEDDAELALINWAANKQENNEVNILQYNLVSRIPWILYSILSLVEQQGTLCSIIS